MAAQAASRRLRKEHLMLERDPELGIWTSPNEKNILHWEFVLLGSDDTPYEGGVYHGRLNFPNSFPMAPPAITMVTPSGRFECGKKICMSMSDFHPELWNPTWSVRTILVGFLSFMNSEEQTTGGMRATASDRVKLAKLSLGATLSNQTYGEAIAQLFPAVVDLAESRKRNTDADTAAAADASSNGSIPWPPPRLTAPPPTLAQLEAREAAKKAAASAEAKRAAGASSTSAGATAGGARAGAAAATTTTTTQSGSGVSSGGGGEDGDEDDPMLGATVELHSLMARPDLNGRKGTVTAYVPAKGRYAVRLEPADVKGVTDDKKSGGGVIGGGGDGGSFLSSFFGTGGGGGGTEVQAAEEKGKLEEVSLKLTNLNLMEMPQLSSPSKAISGGEGGKEGACGTPLTKGQKKKEQQRRRAAREKAEAATAAKGP